MCSWLSSASLHFFISHPFCLPDLMYVGNLELIAAAASLRNTVKFTFSFCFSPYPPSPPPPPVNSKDSRLPILLKLFCCSPTGFPAIKFVQYHWSSDPFAPPSPVPSYYLSAFFSFKSWSAELEVLFEHYLLLPPLALLARSNTKAKFLKRDQTLVPYLEANKLLWFLFIIFFKSYLK